MTESILIIGAGIAGLSAGCYGQMNGYQTRVFEMHEKPGGLCTAWKRKGYTFDGCVHWLAGSGEGAEFNRTWQELGAVQGRQFINHDVFQRIEASDGRAFSMYTDIDRLERHMKALSPADSTVIEELCNGARRLTRGDAPSGPLTGIRQIIGMVPAMATMLKYGRTTAQAFAARFKDPFLRQAFVAGLRDMPEVPALLMMMLIASMHDGDAGYPVGGSLPLAQAVERRYLDLGGEIHYRSRVDRILVEHDRAIGIRLIDGTEHRADIVISAADGHATIFGMLGGRYVSDKVQSYYQELPIFLSCIQVSLGVARDLSDEPHTVVCQLDEPMDIGGKRVEHITFRHLCYDPSMAPPGKSVLIVDFFMCDHAYWKPLSKEPERYEAEKQDVAIKVIGQLERRLPGISEQIEVVDVSTPLTIERYTGNWQGSIQGWMITPNTIGLMLRGMAKTLPGLEGFYMAGQWVEPGGGLPSAATSGRNVIRAICKKDKKAFETSLPAAA